MTDPSSSTAPTAEPILRLRGVSKKFGAVSALTDIDLDVHAGEVVALVGDNGAGKSTLVKVLAGVHQPTSGTIEFSGQAGRRWVAPGEALDLGIATVFQDLALCENLDVVANIFLGQELATRGTSTRWRWRSGPGPSCANLPRASRPSANVIASLSGGQRQTVAIARSLLLDPQDHHARRADRRPGRRADGRGPEPRSSGCVIGVTASS